MKKNFFYLSRLLALLLLDCFISLLSDSAEPIPETLQSRIAVLPGNIRIVINKSAYSLTLYKGIQPWQEFPGYVQHGYRYVRRQAEAGDRRTPEGDFKLCKFLGRNYAVSNITNTVFNPA